MAEYLVLLWLLGANTAPLVYKETVSGSYDDCMRAKKRAIAAWQGRHYVVREHGCFPKRDVLAGAGSP